MFAKLMTVIGYTTLFLLLAVANRSSARIGRMTRETKGHLVVTTNENEEGETKEPFSAIYKADEEQNRLRQRELSRDTFLRLNPIPGGETEEVGRNQREMEEVGHNQREMEEVGRNQREMEEVGRNQANEEGPPRHQQANVKESDQHLQDGDTLLALTSADTLIETAQMNNCRAELFKHRIRMPGCRPKTLVNRFCHGSCASFYIPRLRSKKLKATFQSCAACVPTETDLVQIRLDCPGREQSQLNRTVVRVKRCACRNIALEGEEGNDDEAEEVNGRNQQIQAP